MVEYKDIKKANDSIQTTDLKGKQYAEVNQRIKAFRMLYPTGFIKTEILSLEGGVCIIKAVAGYYENDLTEKVLGTGTAYEKEGSTFINKTSYIENCETSAVGRALGMCGLGIECSVASVEEVQNAIAQQEAMKEAEKKITPVMLKTVQNAIDKGECDLDKLLKWMKIKKLEEMTIGQYRVFMQKAEEAKKEKK